jgi:hypothetical protein
MCSARSVPLEARGILAQTDQFPVIATTRLRMSIYSEASIIPIVPEKCESILSKHSAFQRFCVDTLIRHTSSQLISAGTTLKEGSGGAAFSCLESLKDF